MRVLVCGSRHFNDKQLLEAVFNSVAEGRGVVHPSRAEGITCIIHGCARGADTLAGEYAEANGIPCERYPALWAEHGKRAGPIRNHQMLSEGKPDVVVGFLFKGSRGTAHMLKIAGDAGIETVVIDCE